MNSQTYIQDELDQATSILERSLTGLLELPAVLSRFDSLLDTLTEAIRANNGHVKQLAAAVEDQNRLVGHLGEKQDCLEHSGRLQALLAEEHYAAHVIDPVCRQLFPLVDFLQDAMCGIEGTAGSMQHLRALQDQILELLQTLGVEAVRDSKDEIFDPTIMCPVRRLETDDSRLHGRVAEVVRLGFCRGTAVLRHQGVTVFHGDSPVPLTRSSRSHSLQGA